MNSTLAARFLEDRESLSAAEMESLVDELRRSPEDALWLKQMLMVDDSLGRAYAPDRAHFISQVAQRLAAGETVDETGVSEFEQAVLRQVRGRTVRRQRAWMAPVFAAAAALLIGLGIWQLGLLDRPGSAGPALAALKMESFGAGTRVLRQGQPVSVAAGMFLAAGDEIRTEKGGTAVLAYAGEATRIRLGSSTVMRQGGKAGTTVGAGKRIYLETGSLEGAIAAQPAGRPMMMETPLARATVLGTELRLSSDANRSGLDVEKGSVRLESLATGKSVVVEAGKQGVIRKGESGPSLYGEVLLADDFEKGLENWNIYKEVDEVCTPADAETLKRVRLEKRTDGKPGQWLVIDARNMAKEGEWITLYARKKVASAAVRMSHESIGSQAKQGSGVDWNVFAEGGTTTHARRHMSGGGIDRLMNSDVLWEQRKTDGGCEVYRRSTWDGKPLYEERRFHKDSDKLEARIMLSARECVVSFDNVVVKTVEPVDVPELPAVAKPKP